MDTTLNQVQIQMQEVFSDGQASESMSRGIGTMTSAMCRLRNAAFWYLDSVRGRPIGEAYQELQELDRMDSRSTEMLNHQQLALDNLLQHAISTTKFYEDIKASSLADFPVVNKNIIRDKQDDFISKKYNKSRLITMTTSGSTGTPFICYQNLAKKQRVNAEVIYYSRKAGYSVGSNLIFLRAITEESHKSRLHQWIQNETLLDISNLDDEHIEKLLNSIEKASREGSMILAYASTYDALRDYFRRKGFSAVGNSRIHGVVSSSEMLFDDTREAMTEAFRCPCLSRYSNQENGIIGQDDIENNIFILNEAHYIVETLMMDADGPTREGEVGRIVITDLYNYAMPMIRYDTGDIGSISYVERNGIQKKAITNFGGRKVDVVFDCHGKRLSPHSITNRFWSFPEIRQFQFIQESKTQYTVKISVRDEFRQQTEMREMLLQLLGDEADIKIEVDDEIPVLSSGKRKYIVSRIS